MDVVSWRALWAIAAGLVLGTIPLLVRLLRAERTPQSVARDRPAPGIGCVHWTRGRVLRHWVFWALIPLLLGPPAFGTALFFHQVHFVETKGWTLGAYVALLPIFSLVSILATFASGIVIDRVGAARLMQVYLVPFACAFMLFGAAEGLGGAMIGLMVFGLGTGAQATVPAAFWAEFYGTQHLGAIKALAAAIMVFGSAIGPGATGLLIDAGVDFAAQTWAIAAYFLIAGGLAAWAVGRVRAQLPRPAEIDVIGA